MVNARLPSLTALRVFDVVGRAGSFTHAAEQLCVTQSAVSRQIAALEAELGCQLFLRERSGVRLSDIGRDYHTTVSSSLDQMLQRTIELKQRLAGVNVIRVSALPTMAMHWLLPRVAEFKETLPGVAIDISSSNRLVNLNDGTIDVALRLGNGDWNGLSAHHLFDEQLITVCAPQYANQIAGDIDVEIRQLERLHTTTRPNAWDVWERANGFSVMGDREITAGFQDFFITIQAASLGHGVAVVPSFLVSEEIASGRLIDPFSLPVSSNLSYYFVTSKENSKRTAIQDFRAWISQRAKNSIECSNSL